MKKYYKINKHNSTLCGYPGRDFDWSKLCWDGSAENTDIISKGLTTARKAPLPHVDDYLIAPNCQYLHVPWDWADSGCIYRVRPNASMYAGEIYRGKKIIKQTAVKRKGEWYWVLDFGLPGGETQK